MKNYSEGMTMKTFRSLKILDRFLYKEELFMKIKKCTFKVFKSKDLYGWKQANAVNLKTGNFEWFNNSNKCEVYDASEEF